MDIYIGLDLGCTGCKAVAADENGNVVSTESRRYDGTLLYKGGGAYDQDASVLRNEGLSCLKNLIEKTERKSVRAIGVTAQMHSLVALDKDLRVLRPMISCVDMRNDRQIRDIYEKTGGMEGFLSLTNNRMVASCTGGKIAWMQENEPELFEQVRLILTPKDYFRLVLTGNTGTDESDASGFGLYDVKNRCWSKTLLNLTGISEEILPEVRPSNAFAGRLLPEIAEYLGIPEETRVVMGGGDAVVQTVGAGAVDDGVYSVVLGSGGNMSAHTAAYYDNRDGKIQFYASSLPGKWISYAGLMSIGNTTNWFRNVFARESREPFNLLEKEAAGSAAGSRGLIFYPSMLGQRNPVEDTDARGMFIGLDIEHTRGEMFRSVLEGTALGMKEVSEALIPACGERKTLILSGGGAGNDLWCRIFADVFQVPVMRADHAAYCGAKGAAILASGCDESRKDLEARFRRPKAAGVFEPDRANAELYEELFGIYKSLYETNREAFGKIAAFRTGHET